MNYFINLSNLHIVNVGKINMTSLIFIDMITLKSQKMYRYMYLKFTHISMLDSIFGHQNHFNKDIVISLF